MEVMFDGSAVMKLQGVFSHDKQNKAGSVLLTQVTTAAHTSSGRGKFIWTDPQAQALDFDRGSEAASPLISTIVWQAASSFNAIAV